MNIALGAVLTYADSRLPLGDSGFSALKTHKAKQQNQCGVVQNKTTLILKTIWDGFSVIQEELLTGQLLNKTK